jgi:hypothetical protein
MPPYMDVIHDTFLDVKCYPMNCQSKKYIQPFLTFFEGICVGPKTWQSFYVWWNYSKNIPRYNVSWNLYQYLTFPT